MAQPFSSRPVGRQDRFKIFHYGLVLCIAWSVVQLQAPSSGLCAGAVQSAPQAPSAQPLEPGRPVERELAGGQSHAYRIALKEGQYVQVVIEQRGIDVAGILFGPDGRQLVALDTDSRPRGEERIEQVADRPGDYRIEVRPKLKGATAGRYEIRIENLREATETDRTLHEARQLAIQSASLRDAGKPGEAIPLSERAVAMQEKLLGPNHLAVAVTLHNLALLYSDRGEFGKAEPLYQRVLAIWEQALGPEHPLVANALNNLANLYNFTGDYTKAELLYLRALAIREKVLGPDHPEVAWALASLGAIYFLKGDYEKAETLYKRSLAIRERVFGPEHPAVASVVNNLAILYYNSNDYVRAEPLFLRALAIKEKTLGPEHPDLAGTINNLAAFYQDRGDHLKAEPLLQRALAIWEKALGPEHPKIAIVFHNLGKSARETGMPAKAEQFYQRALAIREKTLGPEHPELASTLASLGGHYVDEDEYAKAEPLLKRALAIWEKVFGERHLDLALPLDELGRLYRYQKDFLKAERFFQRALTIKEQVLGPEHPQVGYSCYYLAEVYAAKGELAQAVKFQSRANTIRERNFALNLDPGSNRQKQAYLALFSSETDFTLWLHSQAAPNDPQARDLALTTLLRRKGRGLDAVADVAAALRRHALPEDQQLLDQLTRTRSQLAGLILKDSNSIKSETYQTQLRSLEEKAEELESVLSSHSAEFRGQTQPVTIAAVQKALPAGSALVEFSTYNQFDPQAGKRGSPHYLVYLLTAQGPPKWVDLGDAAPIDRAIDLWRKALRDPKRADVKRLARAVDERVMRPVRALLDQTSGEPRQLLIAPDGLLNLVPFAALVDEQNRYLVERSAISYLTSGRDLLRVSVPRPTETPALIVANPAFGRRATVPVPADQNPEYAPADQQADQRISRRTGRQSQVKIDPTQIFFQPLPYTEGEAAAIKTLLPEARMLHLKEATEAAVKQSKAPRILHIATHGFFFENQEAQSGAAPENSDESARRSAGLRLSKLAVKIKDPLLRSGLALAGANQGGNEDDDGVLTALEVAGLDLSGTELVVLSACDTGVGEVKNGDGVYGLRRALVLAGSETQIMSLWPVSDQATQDLMVAYYSGLTKGQGRGEALRRVQLTMLKDLKRRHPFYWASFIQSGEWTKLEARR